MTHAYKTTTPDTGGPGVGRRDAFRAGSIDRLIPTAAASSRAQARPYRAGDARVGAPPAPAPPEPPAALQRPGCATTETGSSLRASPAARLVVTRAYAIECGLITDRTS
jgi:hypothetical protein